MVIKALWQAPGVAGHDRLTASTVPYLRVSPVRLGSPWPKEPLNLFPCRYRSLRRWHRRGTKLRLELAEHWHKQLEQTDSSSIEPGGLGLRTALGTTSRWVDSGTYWSAVRLDSSAGRVPVKRLVSSARKVSLVRALMAAGTVPLRVFVATDNALPVGGRGGGEEE